MVLVLLWFANTVLRLHMNHYEPAGGTGVWLVQTIIAAAAAAAVFVGAMLERERFAHRMKQREREEDRR